MIGTALCNLRSIFAQDTNPFHQNEVSDGLQNALKSQAPLLF